MIDFDHLARHSDLGLAQLTGRVEKPRAVEAVRLGHQDQLLTPARVGQRIGWYRPDQGARFIGSIVGAVLILAIYRAIFRGPA